MPHSDTIGLSPLLVFRYVHWRHSHSHSHMQPAHTYIYAQPVGMPFVSHQRCMEYMVYECVCHARARPESLAARTYARRGGSSSCLSPHTLVRVRVRVRVYVFVFRPEATANAVPGKAPGNNHGASANGTSFITI